MLYTDHSVPILLGSKQIQAYSTTIPIDVFVTAFISRKQQLLMKKTTIDRLPSSSSAIICGCASSAFGPESEQVNGEKLYELHLSTVPGS